MKTHVIAVTNQKGGVGKTTTAIHLAHALVIHEPSLKVLLIDLDPQGNATQGLGIRLESVTRNIGDLIRERVMPTDEAIYRGLGLELIPSTPSLAKVEREMTGVTNSELRLLRRIESLNGRYDVIIIDTPPTFGPLMNSALNAAQKLIVPVDSSFYAMVGIKELLAEIEEIQLGINPRLEVLGYLLTLVDHTKISQEISNGLISSFGPEVFDATIRRSVKFKEASALGRTVFQHALKSPGYWDYLRLAEEVLGKLGIRVETAKEATPALSIVQGGGT